MAYRIYENRLNMVEFQKLRLASGFEPLESGRLKKALSASLVRLSAEEDGETVGMVRVAGDGAFVFVIADLLVRPDCRGRGIGTELVNHAVDAISAMLPKGMWATVTLIAAAGRESFYDGLGFHRIPKGEVGNAMQAYVRGSK